MSIQGTSLTQLWQFGVTAAKFQSTKFSLAREAMRVDRAKEFLRETERLTRVRDCIGGEATGTWLTSTPPATGEPSLLPGSKPGNALYPYKR